jgi:hypothetical protein
MAIPLRWLRKRVCGWFKKGSGTVAETAPRVLGTTVPDPFLNQGRVCGLPHRGLNFACRGLPEADPAVRQPLEQIVRTFEELLA